METSPYYFNQNITEYELSRSKPLHFKLTERSRDDVDHSISHKAVDHTLSVNDNSRIAEMQVLNTYLDNNLKQSKSELKRSMNRIKELEILVCDNEKKHRLLESEINKLRFSLNEKVERSTDTNSLNVKDSVKVESTISFLESELELYKRTMKNKIQREKDILENNTIFSSIIQLSVSTIHSTIENLITATIPSDKIKEWGIQQHLYTLKSGRTTYHKTHQESIEKNDNLEEYVKELENLSKWSKEISNMVVEKRSYFDGEDLKRHPIMTPQEINELVAEAVHNQLTSMSIISNATKEVNELHFYLCFNLIGCNIGWKGIHIEFLRH